jgi:hypothetical protein
MLIREYDVLNKNSLFGYIVLNFPNFVKGIKMLYTVMVRFVAMSRLLFFLASLIFFPAYGFSAGDEVARQTYPYVVVEPDRFDFGQLTTGQPITGKIELSNEGAYDLVIAKARSSCGLMIQTWPSAPVAPGDKVSISFRFDTNRTGPFFRLITIHTNAWQKNLVIEVKGEVMPDGSIRNEE